MSGIGFAELVILFLIGLIVLGPERLPRVANQLGSWLGQARRMTRVMKRQLEDELNLEKDFNINPLPPTTSRNGPDKEKDDTYSPAHGADDIGTGVGNDDEAQEPDDAGDPAHESGGDAKAPDEPEAPIADKEPVS